MKRIFNVLLSGVIFYVGNMFFSEYVSYDTIQTLIIAVLLFATADILYGILVTAVLGIGCIGGAGGIMLAIIPIILSAFVWVPLKLVLMNKFIDGFSINGFITYVLLTFALSIFSFKIETKKEV